MRAPMQAKAPMRFWTPKVLSENTIATGGVLQCQLLCRHLLWRHSLWRHSLWRVMLRRVGCARVLGRLKALTHRAPRMLLKIAFDQSNLLRHHLPCRHLLWRHLLWRHLPSGRLPCARI